MGDVSSLRRGRKCREACVEVERAGGSQLTTIENRWSVYAQAFTRRYFTFAKGEVTYSGEERLDGMSIAHGIGRHDMWIDSLNPAHAVTALRALSLPPRVPSEVLKVCGDIAVQPASVGDAATVSASLSLGVHVRLEFELVHRHAVMHSEQQRDAVHSDGQGIRCRVIVEDEHGIARGRAYTEARSSSIEDLDIRGAVLRAELEAQQLQSSHRLSQAASMRVLLAPSTAAALLHELCGHTLEADVEKGGASDLTQVTGGQIASEKLTVTDDPSPTHLWGHYLFDDEGRAASPVHLIQEGRVHDTLRDERRGGDRGSNGRGRRTSHQVPPVPRMSNLVINSGNSSQDELLGQAAGGIWLKSLERAQLVARQGVLLLHARLASRLHADGNEEPLRGVVLKGGVRELLGAIANVGATSESFSGYCGKAGQRIPFGAVAPALLLSDALVIPY